MEKTNTRILILSDSAWDEQNNIGNTFSNIFSNWNPDDLAVIYARPSLPNTPYCNNHFQISETRLLKNLFDKKIKTGIKIKSTSNIKKSGLEKDIEVKKGENLYSFFSKFRLKIFLILRELLWFVGRWKTEELEDFVNEFNPDIIFSLASPNAYMNRIQQYLVKKEKVPHIIYFVDDISSFKQFSINPLYWINKLISHLSIRKTMRTVSLVYTITEFQLDYLESKFANNYNILTKGVNVQPKEKTKFDNLNLDDKNILKFVFTGNIYAGRWNTLVSIATVLEESGGLLDIYTLNKLTQKQMKQVQKLSSLQIKEPVPMSEIPETLSKYDVLLHVESLKMKEKLLTRMSFSTKIVDYLGAMKPILAVGWDKSYSIHYLENNKAALIVTDLKELNESILSLKDSKIRSKLVENAYETLVENHNIIKIQNDFSNTVNNLLGEKSNENYSN